MFARDGNQPLLQIIGSCHGILTALAGAVWLAGQGNPCTESDTVKYFPYVEAKEGYMTQTPPEKLSERELFTEYVELLKQPETDISTYEEVKFDERQARLLAEIGERLETLEAVKSLVKTSQSNDEAHSQPHNHQEQPGDHHEPLSE
jgi:hypothetical protein